MAGSRVFRCTVCMDDQRKIKYVVADDEEHAKSKLMTKGHWWNFDVLPFLSDDIEDWRDAILVLDVTNSDLSGLTEDDWHGDGAPDWVKSYMAMRKANESN